MGKRIFTKRFSGRISCGFGDPAIVSKNAIESWLVQEDMEVVGASIAVGPSVPSENDGYTYCAVELSQVGIAGLDGSILTGYACEGWNTTPAGITQVAANVAISFPNGTAIPVKEEGYLYINCKFVGKSAGESFYDYGVTVYYTKKGSK
ncbi:hypothetical protein ES705_43115 [subsurface metagenome]